MLVAAARDDGPADAPARLPRPVAPLALDFRHESWDGIEADLPPNAVRVNAFEAEAPFRYLRLREPPYDDDDLRGWAERLRPLLDDGIRVYCYFKHEDEPTAPAYAAGAARSARGVTFGADRPTLPDRVKVVIFCGGQGMRLETGNVLRAPPEADGLDRRPAPAVAPHEVLRPLRAHRVRALPRLPRRGDPGLLRRARSSREAGWEIDFVDTGIESSIGERLAHARDHVGEREVFLASYGDTLTDAPLRS